MPTPAKIFFLYKSGDGWTARDSTMEEAEVSVRYWLGKSPGAHAMEEILVVADEHAKSYLWVVDKLAEESAIHDERIFEQRERQEYERLKKKFGPK